jgi:predicted dehydrogenase
VLRVGFIGLGHISHENVLGYLGHPDATVTAVCSRDGEVAMRDWLTRYGFSEARTYGTPEQMLEHQAFDIVEVLTPHHLHRDHVVACARSGVRGISVQKPMATRLADCEDMIDACARAGSVLKVYENFLFYPVYVRAKELISEGLIGNPISIRVNTLAGKRQGAPWPWPFVPGSWRADLDLAGTGPLVGDDGFHKFSLARWFMERDIERIGAWIDSETPLDAPAMIRARFRRFREEPARYAQVDFSFLPEMAAPFDFWLDEFVEIVGDEAVMWINQCSAAGDRVLFRGNQMSESPAFPPIAVYRNGVVTTYLTELSPSERNWSTSFLASTRHFIDVMKNGGQPIYSGADGMEVTRYAIAATLSAQLGHDVDLDEVTADAERGGRFRLATAFLNLPSTRD